MRIILGLLRKASRISITHSRFFTLIYGVSLHNFWRIYGFGDGQEIDFVEEREGKLFGYEFKWSNNKKEKVPKDWFKSYDNTEYEVISRSNYLEFIL